ncbi:hypothetical protein [Dolichospermum compactum]|uniref:Uncharacterized protein n=1 Tax=Dolichospermum compactum NIES-806 TaxID=1973481 RepID=A0A1Z4V9L3_9CYAN|nr:hypothetical protein [Dolichospermum compactum]BAZ88138.1 hypothetical protein NIES806_43720 [Dolichospermum compactum NIES-806]
MLEPTTLAIEATKIVFKVLDNVTEGGLQEVGKQILNYLQEKLRLNFQLEQGKQDTALLQTIILDKVLEDNQFKNDLEQLVLRFEKLENTNNSAKVLQNNQYGSNISADNIINPQFINNPQIFRK